MSDAVRSFEWHVVPSHAEEYRPLANVHWSRMRNRITDDRALRNPADDHDPARWPPAGPLAPLADLALEPMPIALCPTGHLLFAPRPAEGGSRDVVLARGTQLRPASHYVDRYQSGCDFDAFEILEGPNAGRMVGLCCNGGWSVGAELADALLADAAEPIFANHDAGVRLLADLRAITDDVRKMVPEVAQ